MKERKHLYDEPVDYGFPMPFGRLVLTGEGNIVSADSTAASLLGLADLSLVGESFSLFVYHEDQEAFFAYRKQILELQQAGGGRLEVSTTWAEQIMRMVKQDGSLFWAQLKAIAELAEGQSRIIVVLDDITERTRAEEEKDVLRKQNQIQKEKSLERMAEAIAHLFNNNLQIILGNLEMALHGIPEDQAQRRYLLEAVKATNKSTEISRLMLTYLGHNDVPTEEVDLTDGCRSELAGLKVHMSRHISIETDFMSFGPIVRASTVQLQVVVAQLVTNSREAIGEQSGRITVATRIVPAAALPPAHPAFNGWIANFTEYACLDVSDTGCGLSESEISLLFDPFYSTKFTGRGMGLSLVKGIVKAWGGMISVMSVPGRGASFRIFLPLVSNAVYRPADQQAEAAQAAGKGAILVVDDDPIVLEITRKILQKIGYQAIVAENGYEAIALFKKHQRDIQCLLTDWHMPGIDGLKLAEMLRQIRPDLPVVLSSGYRESTVMSAGPAEKPHAFLSKPYTRRNLEDTLDQVIWENGDAVPDPDREL